MIIVIALTVALKHKILTEAQTFDFRGLVRYPAETERRKVIFAFCSLTYIGALRAPYRTPGIIRRTDTICDLWRYPTCGVRLPISSC